MAKKASGSVNKSQSIRDALTSNPSKSPKEIAAMLTEQGMPVTAAYVSIVKSQSKLKGTTTKRVKVPRATATATTDGSRNGGMSALSAAVTFIRAVGGLSAAKQALSAVEEIKGL